MIYTDKAIEKETERQDVRCLYEELLKNATAEQKEKAIIAATAFLLGSQQKSAQEEIYMANTHTDEIFNVYGALDNLNKRMKIVEEKVPNYTADMLEVYRNLGALTKRIAELENLINKETTTLKRGEEDE